MTLIVVAPASAYNSPLNGWWRFDENSGSVARDSSGNGNNGTISPAAQRAPGYFGSALAFDGGTAQVDVPDSPSLEPASAITVAAWVKDTAPAGNFRYIVSKGVAGCNAGSYGLFTGEHGGLQFYVSQNQGLSYVLSPDAGTGYWDGNWHLVVGTYDGNAVHLYVDGRQIGSGTPETGNIGYGLPDSNDLLIGNYNFSCPGYNLDFSGSIDEPTVWSRAFSPAEVFVDNTLLVGLHRLIGRLSAWPGA
jgi:hypothetical protein